jgi:hypothetical protein
VTISGFGTDAVGQHTKPDGGALLAELAHRQHQAHRAGRPTKPVDVVNRDQRHHQQEARPREKRVDEEGN